MSENYTDLLIRIEARNPQTGRYSTEASLANGSFFDGGQLEIDLPTLNALDAEPEAYGQALTRALFQGPIQTAYQYAKALHQNRVRLRLWIDHEAAELHALSWERLRLPDRLQEEALSTNANTPFSRYIGLQMAEPRPLTARPIKMLIIVSNPTDLPDYGMDPVDVETEVLNLFKSLPFDEASYNLQITLLPGHTKLSTGLTSQLLQAKYKIQPGPASLNNVMSLIAEFHIVYYVGHGTFRRSRSTGEGFSALYLESDTATEARVQVVRDQELTERLRATGSLPHLMFLNACETSNRDPLIQHPFVGLGPKLVSVGVPAVIAMREAIIMDTARTLAKNFYKYLRKDAAGMVDVALNRARALLPQADQDIPILFMRLETGQLLAPSPVRTAIEAMSRDPAYTFFASEQYLPLPIDVVHLMGRQDAQTISNYLTLATAAIDVSRALNDIFENRREETTQALAQAAEQGEAVPPKSQPTLVVLSGDHGTGKTVQLRFSVWECIQAWLTPGGEPAPLPVYVNLDQYAQLDSTWHNPVETLIYRSLQPFWPDLGVQGLLDMAVSGPPMRIVFDNDDNLSERERRTVWKYIEQVILQYPHHQYILGANPSYFDASEFDNEDLTLHTLVLQKLPRRKIIHFLERMQQNMPQRPFGKLLQAMDDAQVFELAATPWFLIRLIQQALAGDYPQSTTQVLNNVVEDAIAKIPVGQGMRNHAETVLYRLAWEMQSSLKSTWPINNVFWLMDDIRGNREYNLEEFYDILLDSGLLVRLGDDKTRFVHASIQAYCSARYILQKDPRQRDHILNDITATLGRLNRLYWWNDTLVLLTGLLARDTVSLRKLLEVIVYGVDLLQSDQTFLAADCLVELCQYQLELKEGHGDWNMDLPTQVINALVWRLDGSNEPRISHRIKAADLLGRLYSPFYEKYMDEAISVLINIAIRKARIDSKGEPDYDFISIRMAAVLALRRINHYVSNDKKARLAPELLLIQNWWLLKDVDWLIELFYKEEDVGLQSLVALALGDLQSQFSIIENRRDEDMPAMDALLSRLEQPNLPEPTFWGINLALALQDSSFITEKVILPGIEPLLLDTGHYYDDVDTTLLRKYKTLVFLIGRSRCQNEVAHDFLVNHALRKFCNMGLIADVVEAIGWLSDERYREVLECLAIGDFRHAPQATDLSESGQLYIQRRAIESLAMIGNLATITRLRQVLSHQHAHKPDMLVPIRRAFYRTSEEIYWRMNRTQ